VIKAEFSASLHHWSFRNHADYY